MTGRRNFSDCSSLVTLPSRNMLPSSGAAQFMAMGPRVDQPAASKITAWPMCERPHPP
ncbi:Uncharacterised protein [Mycobacteroides abscessus subsp. abscessus]|nr:Uncharacterised protein [Mycobacteroides abscessus subsp. abscessus]